MSSRCVCWFHWNIDHTLNRDNDVKHDICYALSTEHAIECFASQPWVCQHEGQKAGCSGQKMPWRCIRLWPRAMSGWGFQCRRLMSCSLSNTQPRWINWRQLEWKKCKTATKKNFQKILNKCDCNISFITISRMAEPDNAPHTHNTSSFSIWNKMQQITAITTHNNAYVLHSRNHHWKQWETREKCKTSNSTRISFIPEYRAEQVNWNPTMAL